MGGRLTAASLVRRALATNLVSFVGVECLLSKPSKVRVLREITCATYRLGRIWRLQGPGRVNDGRNVKTY